MATKTPTHKVSIKSSLVALSALHVAFVFNESRKGISTIKELLGTSGKKTVVIAKTSQDLLSSMLERGFDSVEIMITTDVGIDKAGKAACVKKFREELTSQTKEMETLPLFSGEKGTFIYKDKTVDMTHEDFSKEWNRTFPTKVKGKDRITEKTEAVLSGNRRIVVLVLYNAIVRKAGLEKNVVNQILREKRTYNSVRARKDDSVYLNERGKEGKLESTKLQKLRVGKSKLEDGAIQSEFNSLFANNRGAVQLAYGTAACIRIVSWLPKVVYSGKEMTGKAAYDVIWADIFSSKTPVPNQGKLARLTGMRMQSEHNDGHLNEFRFPKKGKPNAKNANTHLGQNAVSEFKKHVKAHPEIGQRICDYFLNIQDDKWVDPENGKSQTRSSLASTTLEGVAVNCDGLVETLLKTAAGIDTGCDLAATAKAITDELADRVKMPNADGTLGDPLTQDEVNTLACFFRKGNKADGDLTGQPISQDVLDKAVYKKKGSGRRSRAG